MRLPIFSDPMYSAELDAQFDPLDVIAIEEKQIALFLRGRHWATYITLKNGVEHTLQGQVASQIRQAQRAAREAAQSEQ